MKKKPTPAQLAARAKFAEMARSGAFKKKKRVAKKNPAKKTVSDKISQLVHEGYPQKQAIAVALSEMRAGKVKNNPAKKPLKMKIRGSETLDHPEGLIVTKKGALRFARQNMPADLKRAGFVPSVVEGARGWSINYGMSVKKNPIVLVSDAPAKRRTKKNPITLISDKPKKNPVTRAYSKKKANFPFVVEYKNKATGNWNSKGAFKTNAEAKNYAYALHASHPSATIRVMKYTGGAMQ